MKVIHDNEMGGIAMIPLIVDWGVSRKCQVEGCKNETNTILCVSREESPVGEALHIGICEQHYRESKVGEGEFDFRQTIMLGLKED